VGTGVEVGIGVRVGVGVGGFGVTVGTGVRVGVRVGVGVGGFGVEVGRTLARAVGEGTTEVDVAGGSVARGPQAATRGRSTSRQSQEVLLISVSFHLGIEKPLGYKCD
jgi:hypothetical protein